MNDQRAPRAIDADAPDELKTTLRIHRALRMARLEEQEAVPEQAPRLQGIWRVRSVPRPPLVAVMLKEPPSEELLENDSPGG